MTFFGTYTVVEGHFSRYLLNHDENEKQFLLRKKIKWDILIYGSTREPVLLITLLF